jgi:PAS domain S-box-containing protein
MFLFDLETRKFTLCNAMCSKMLGFTPEEFLNLDIADIHRPEGLRLILEQVGKSEKGEQGARYDIKFRRKDGTLLHTDLSPALVTLAGRQFILVVFKDITERKRAEERLVAYQENLRSLASELSLAEERERRRIASYLHDEIGQSLAAIRMKFGALKQAGSSAEIAGMVDEIQTLLEWTIRDTRSLTFELSPPILYELGLSAALEWLSERIGEEQGIRIEFADDAHSKPLEDDVRGLLFRAVDELLINIVKHANTRSGKVSILRDGDHVRIVVEDDGVGFDATTIESRTNRDRGFGLFSVRERLRYIGGHVEVESERGHGTRVTLIAPLSRDRTSLEGGAPCK